MACERGHLEVAKALIEAGGKPLLLKNDIVWGRSCLHAASSTGHIAVVNFLLTLNCAELANLRDFSGHTALDLAGAKGHTRVAKAIRAYCRHTAATGSSSRACPDASMIAVDDQGLTALHYAAIDGNLELARTLIEH